MESVRLLLLLLFTTVSGKSHVHRRGLTELATTITCATKSSALVYLKYGCYCGLGGSGQPQDQVDWCCQKHDCCYKAASDAGCIPKLQTYSWNCVNNTVECASSQSKCAAIACKCDQELSHCLASAKYNKKHFLSLASDCGDQSPKCE
ncbi:group 10 secretory phospholipase A2 [Monodelphis domestica]|uniref:Phospholipase A2 n=1 Tax=Monodelphis domestica TaxID=13616 RepID=F7A6K0_MONDO|nr:group 10 secretory phospholipase A2 [Monodelphis domestica]